ncbi:hypothetical protein ACFV1L_21985 [Kitasatospora sp. NPDC059646]|uniref:hypothetical protein n=1 Tax=Kitasatospora sp. NPDC059646 TaxID=3346893 RepID=UPI003694F956
MNGNVPDAILTDPGLQSLTSEKMRIHHNDAMHYRQMADRLNAHLREHHIDGDGMFSRWWRAWRVARLARRMSDLSAKIAATNQALYSTYHNQVTRVPEKRAAAEAKKSLKNNHGQLPAGQQMNAPVMQFSTGNFLNPTPPPVQQNNGSTATVSTAEWSIYTEFDGRQAQ